MTRHERTSKPVAKHASVVLREAQSTIEQLRRMRLTIDRTIALLEKAEKVAASCLTQTEPDRKER